MNRMLAVTVLTMWCVTGSTLAGDAWWKSCRPMADYTHPGCDPCAKQKFKWAAMEVCCAPDPCIKKRCSLKEACCEYRAAWRKALCGREVCCNLKKNCGDALNAYRCAAGELCACRECERR